MSGILPRTITILTGGEKDADNFHQYLIDEHPDDLDNWTFVDLQPLLKKDPATSIGHKEGFESTQTQTVVMGQEAFANTLQGVMKQSLPTVDGAYDGDDYKDKFFVFCRTGWHRAGVTGKALKEAYNYIEIDDGRVFNCQTFSLQDSYGHRDYRTRMSNAVRWSEEPWTIIEGGYRSRGALWGYTAASSNPYAWVGFREFWDFVDEFVTVIDKIHKQVLVPSQPLFPPPAPPFPIKGDHGEHDDDKWLDDASWAAREDARENERSSYDSQRGEQSAKHEESSSHDSRPSYATRPKDEPPSWATVKRDPSLWWHLFEKVGVDSYARKDVYALAQTSDEGHKAAMAIIFKLLKKDTDGEEYDTSPSAFVHSCAKNAMQELNGSWFENKKKRKW